MLTPEEINRQITASGNAGRNEDRRAIAAARQMVEEVGAKLGRQLDAHVMAGDQRRRVLRVGLIGLVAGAMLWAALAGPIARSLPPGWLMPERMAARTLRMSMWESGQRLMRAGNGSAFAGVLAADRLATANRDTLAACRKQAARTEKVVRCVIQVRAGGPDER